jgi:hypothetical protein
MNMLNTSEDPEITALALVSTSQFAAVTQKGTLYVWDGNFNRTNTQNIGYGCSSLCYYEAQLPTGPLPFLICGVFPLPTSVPPSGFGIVALSGNNTKQTLFVFLFISR